MAATPNPKDYEKFLARLASVSYDFNRKLAEDLMNEIELAELNGYITTGKEERLLQLLSLRVVKS